MGILLFSKSFAAFYNLRYKIQKAQCLRNTQAHGLQRTLHLVHKITFLETKEKRVQCIQYVVGVIT